ncbi:MAG: hypothetical protein PHY59_03400 [Methanobacterium sp.]|nr:hypothetical protein [Methanobacterium sp.]
MDEKIKKIFTKKFSILETKNSLIKEPEYLDNNYAPLGIGLPDIYKKMENKNYSLPKIEDIQKRIDTLKTQENIDPDIIEVLKKMKKASEIQNRLNLDPLKEIQEFKNVYDIVKDEHNTILNGTQLKLSQKSIQIINKQIKSSPKIFRSKYPELFDHITSNTD